MRISTKIVSGLTLIATAGLVLAQTYPQWWLDQNVVSSQPPAAPSAAYDKWMADNYAFANLGQAKHLAEQATNAMNAAQAGSAGSAIASTIAGFSTLPKDNYVPFTIGQLKALSAPFYDVMHAANFTVTLGDGTIIPNGSYPWTTDVTPDNLAVANLGQLKHVFSFDLSDWGIAWEDVPQAWKQALINSPDAEFYDPEGDVTVANMLGTRPWGGGSDYKYWDFDGDGISNLTEYINGTDAADYFNGQSAILKIEAGNYQTTEPNTALDMPLLISVVNSEGAPYQNVPVIFESIQNDAISRMPSNTGGDLVNKILTSSQNLGAMVFYRTSDKIGFYKVIARIPGGTSIEFDLASYTPPSATEPTIYNYESVDNGDGTKTYSWSSNVLQGQWFELSYYDDSGEYQLVFRALYGSNELPLNGQSGLQNFSVTLPSASE